MQEGEFILHGYFRSSAAYRVRIALNLKGLTYQGVAHHLRRGEQYAAAYRSLNPQGLVPTLEVNGLALTQSLAIIEYLEERYPEPALLPKTPESRARVRSLAQITACDIHPLNNLRVLNYLRQGLEHTEDVIQAWYAHWVVEGFDAIERFLCESPDTGLFCHGDSPTVADVCLVPQVANARNFKLDLSQFPTIQRIDAIASTLPAFRKALPSNQPDAE
ncbi:maleylacetoacetate isomerase [uncultured Sphingosinicella sp.]|uniref:maleylacetoacetate isomerase n=1 Tax=uncultured Sphingosinicella sp. TaxID=478748 RepID=UPI0030D98175|tara:strand:- start:29592 stop:30245 length:654 start_codon:yes stop_codon:yes gene_type:complete